VRHRSQVSIQPIESFPYYIETRGNVSRVLKEYVPFVFRCSADQLEQHFLGRLDRIILLD
jgi:hypothetical protein